MALSSKRIKDACTTADIFIHFYLLSSAFTPFFHPFLSSTSFLGHFFFLSFLNDWFIWFCSYVRFLTQTSDAENPGEAVKNNIVLLYIHTYLLKYLPYILTIHTYYTYLVNTVKPMAQYSTFVHRHLTLLWFSTLLYHPGRGVFLSMYCLADMYQDHFQVQV